MAMFQTHVSAAAVLGAAYGAAGVFGWQLDWGIVLLSAGLCTLGGMLPDLDSDSGRPVRELSILAGFIFPILLIPRLRRWGLSLEQGFVIVIGAHFLIRVALAAVIRRISVHRGMFHSLPALAIAALAVFLVYHNDDLRERVFVSGAMAVGFLSHLLLDELYSVNFNGIALSFNKFAGSAVKLYSASWRANFVCYALLGLLGYMSWKTLEAHADGSLARELEERNTYRRVIRPGVR